MRFPRLATPAAVLALAVVASENTARALGPVVIEVGAKLGGATNPFDGRTNAFGFGLGARAGVGLRGFYGGISAVHYLGAEHENVLLDPPIKTHYSSTLLGIELGYTISALPIINIRPQLGIGRLTIAYSGDAVDASDNYPYIEPGVAVLVPIDILYVGGDVNALIIPGVDAGTETKTATSLTIHGQIGVRF